MKNLKVRFYESILTRKSKPWETTRTNLTSERDGGGNTGSFASSSRLYFVCGLMLYAHSLPLQLNVHYGIEVSWGGDEIRR